MTGRKEHGVLCSVCLLVALLVPAVVEAQRPLRQVILLEHDVEEPVVIDTNNVTLDCDGHAVATNGGYAGITVDGVSGVMVRNCVVDGTIGRLTYGIRMINGASRNTISDNVVSDCSSTGIQLFEHSSDNVIEGNMVAQAGAYGIQVRNTSSEYVTGNVIVENVVEGSGATGISVSRFADGVIADNAVAYSGGDGISLVSSTGNEVDGNTVLASLSHGAVLSQGTDNTFINNVSSDNEGLGLLVDEGSADNLFLSNGFLNNLSGGVQFSDDSDSNVFGQVGDGNWACENDGFDINSLDSFNIGGGNMCAGTVGWNDLWQRDGCAAPCPAFELVDHDVERLGDDYANMLEAVFEYNEATEADQLTEITSNIMRAMHDLVMTLIRKIG